MEKENRNSLMEIFIKSNIFKVNQMVLDNISGKMAISIKDNSKMVLDKVTELLNKMEISITV
jgi:hypothetical protein